MKNHMMAAVLYGKEHLQVEPVAVPTIDAGDVLVRVKVALTCGTDATTNSRAENQNRNRDCQFCSWGEATIVDFPRKNDGTAVAQ